ncbi:DUF4340 domain-containing protein, partial [Candidatus Dependentiae bacterium]|nr:DUF4340 domain-containing protein [Candidatus Dependentiae bacterium]
NTSIPFYSVSNDIIKELKINYLDLKNEKIFGDDIKKEDISNFQIKKSNSSLSLKFENGLFSSSNNELNKNSEAINDLIHNIQLFKVTKFVSDKASDLFEFSLDKPELQIFYEIKGIKRTLNFSKKKNIFYGVIFEQQEMDIFETPPSKDGKIPEFLEPISKYIN